MNEKVVFIVGPQKSGTKMLASAMIYAFDLSGEHYDGRFYPIDGRNGALVRYSVPTGYHDSCTEKIPGFPISQETADAVGDWGWPVADSVISMANGIYSSPDIHVISPFRDFHSVIETFAHQGFTRDEAYELHDFSLCRIEDFRNRTDCTHHWISYDLFVHIPFEYMMRLGELIGLEVDERRVRHAASKISSTSSTKWYCDEDAKPFFGTEIDNE